MTGSIFEAAMGPAFADLHPMLRRRFGVSLASGTACVGRGTMRRIRRGPWWTVPFLQLGRLRNILVPDVGDDVPFVIENHAYRDPLGRETVTFVRTYRIGGRTARFDATMILDERRGLVVDYLGTHQHLAVDLDLAVREGALHLRSGDQRFHEGRVSFRFPLRFSGRADLVESFDDATGEFVVRLRVMNPVLGFLFGYEGRFTCEFLQDAPVPPHLLPRRHEARR